MRYRIRWFLRLSIKKRQNNQINYYRAKHESPSPINLVFPQCNDCGFAEGPEWTLLWQKARPDGAGDFRVNGATELNRRAVEKIELRPNG